MTQHTFLLNCSSVLLIIILCVTNLILASCTARQLPPPIPPKKEAIFRCEKDENLIYETREDFCKCLGIESGELEKYREFKIDRSVNMSFSQIDDELLRDELIQLMIIEIKKELYRVFKEYDPDQWESSKMNVPYVYARFVKKSETGQIRAVALVKANDLEGVNVLKHMPLEYKQHYLEKMKIRLNGLYR